MVSKGQSKLKLLFGNLIFNFSNRYSDINLNQRYLGSNTKLYCDISYYNTKRIANRVKQTRVIKRKHNLFLSNTDLDLGHRHRVASRVVSWYKLLTHQCWCHYVIANWSNYVKIKLQLTLILITVFAVAIPICLLIKYKSYPHFKLCVDRPRQTAVIERNFIFSNSDLEIDHRHLAKAVVDFIITITGLSKVAVTFTISPW